MEYRVPKLNDFSGNTLGDAVKELLAALQKEAHGVTYDADWKAFRDRWLARKSGILTQVNDLWLKGAPKAAKREVGRHVNEVKARIESEVESARTRLRDQIIEVEHPGIPVPAADLERYRLEKAENVDITLPGIRRPIGAEHPIIRTSNEIVSVFQKLGYSVAEGPVVETDYYNFEALNFPPNHPARDTQDTLFIAGQ